MSWGWFEKEHGLRNWSWLTRLSQIRAKRKPVPVCKRLEIEMEVPPNRTTLHVLLKLHKRTKKKKKTLNVFESKSRL